METPQAIRRLCSEIQLFDLCELDDCSHKDGRFCTEMQILERFEAIKEEDERSYVAEELDEDEVEGEGEGEDDDDYGGDGYEDEDY